MRILVYGAGVLGSNLANNLFRGGKDVTLLARGQWAKQIRNHGLCIHHYFGRITLSRIPVIEKLETQDFYDVIFVVVRYTQLDSVISVLKTNVSKNIVFVGNNVRCEKYRKMLKEKNVMFAFALSAGYRKSDHLESVDLKKITIGRLKDEPRDEELTNEIFGDSGYRITYESNMGDWLLCHAAAVLPIAFACYYTDGEIKKIRKDKIYLSKLTDATISAYEVLDRNGHEILPVSERDYAKPGYRRLSLLLYRLICSTRIGKLCTCGHAMNAADEMNALNEDLKDCLGQYEEVPAAWLDLEEKTKGYLKGKKAV